MPDDQTLRATFNSAVDDYDAIRPSYPAALIEDVLSLGAVPAGGEALEIGCGTGQATRLFAQKGLHILCLDIGPDLLARAAENLRAFPNVQFKQTAFEDWPAWVGHYDLIYAATAFHWIPPAIGYPKTALALRPGGALADFSNQHPRPYSGFFCEVEAVYKHYVPEWADPAAQPDTVDEIRAKVDRIQAAGLFAEVTVKTYPWQVDYATADYLRLLNTYSNHLALAADRRKALYGAIADLIERRYAGKVERPYLAVLYLARKSQ